MPFYNSTGKIPKKRHTVFKNPKGGIYYEELVSREGFAYMYSNLYHLRMPTQVMRLSDFKKEINFLPPDKSSPNPLKIFVCNVEINLNIVENS